MIQNCPVSNPCSSNGNCINGGTANDPYICECNLGYTGENCDGGNWFSDRRLLFIRFNLKYLKNFFLNYLISKRVIYKFFKFAKAGVMPEARSINISKYQYKLIFGCVVLYNTFKSWDKCEKMMIIGKKWYIFIWKCYFLTHKFKFLPEKWHFLTVKG